jgi:hypothetical protein
MIKVIRGKDYEERYKNSDFGDERLRKHDSL